MATAKILSGAEQAAAVAAAAAAGVNGPVLAPSASVACSTLDPTSYMLPKKTRRRRKVHELDRSYECHYDGCERRYASESALHQHLWLKHQIKRCRSASSEAVPLAPQKPSPRAAPYQLPTHLKQNSPPLSRGPSPLARIDSAGTPPATAQAQLETNELLRLLLADGKPQPADTAMAVLLPHYSPPTPPASAPLAHPPLPSAPGTPPSGAFVFPPSPPLGPKAHPLASMLAPRKSLRQQTDQELKAELRRLLAMFQTVEAMESVVFSCPPAMAV